MSGGESIMDASQQLLVLYHPSHTLIELAPEAGMCSYLSRPHRDHLLLSRVLSVYWIRWRCIVVLVIQVKASHMCHG